MADSKRKKKKDEALHAERETTKFKFMCDNSNDSFYLTDREARFHYANKVACESLGYSEKELLAMTIQDVDTVFDIKKYQELFDLVQKDRSSRFESVNKRKDGSLFPSEFSVSGIQLGKVPYMFAVSRDIAGRKQSEEALRISEEKYKNIAETSTHCICYLDIKGKYLYMNPGGCRINEVDKQKDILGKSCIDYVVDENKDAMKDALGQAKKGATVHLEYASLTRKGGKIYWDSTISPVKDEKDRVVSLIRISTDVTGLKLSEEQLRKSEERFRGAFENSKIGLNILDADYNYLKVNKAFCEMLGYSEDELVGGNFTRITHPEDIGKNLALSKKLRKGEINSFHIEKRYIHKEGGLVWGDLTVSAVRDDDGRLLQVVALIQDITERQIVKIALEESEERHRNLVETSHDLIFKADKEGRFTYLNPAWETVLGYKHEEMMGHRFSDFKTPEQAEKDMEAFKSTLAGQETFGYETVYISKSGKRVFLDINSRFFKDVDGNVVGTQGTAHDVTERKMAETALIKAKEDAENATKLKDKFVNLVAHDMLSPFTSIVGMMEVLQDDPELNLNLRQNELLEQILGNSFDMVSMITKMLDISRFKTGKIGFKPRFFDAHVICEAVQRNKSFVANEKGIEIISKVPVGTRLYADKPLFIEVISNLVSNAIKFCSNGAAITLFVPKNRPTTIAVKDNGPGVVDDIVPDIFKSEVKTTTSGTSGEPGTGLGLPYSYDIMKEHGGDLTVESSKGKGSTFYAELPFVKPRVLVVDDESAVRRMFKLFIKKLKVDVIEVVNGREALEAVKENPPHLIICDIIMPVMDGFGFLKEIKGNDKTKSIPVIIVTADSKMETRNKILRMGADDFVAKPFQVEDFLPRVKKFIV